MNKVVLVLAIAFVAMITVSLIAVLASPADSDDIYAELLMPGNTLVVGKVDRSQRMSGNWIKLTINGVEYKCNDWRVVLYRDKNMP